MFQKEILQKVISSNLPLREASNKFGVPRVTVRDYTHRKLKIIFGKMVHQPTSFEQTIGKFEFPPKKLIYFLQ